MRSLPAFTLATPRVRLVWTGPALRPEGTLHAEAARGTLFLKTAGEVGEGRVVSGPGSLEEEARYAVLLQSLDGRPVALRHRDPVVTGGLAASPDGATVYGPLTLGGHVGPTAFEVLHDGAPEATLKLVVQPAKLSAAAVEQMRRELDEALAGWGLEYLRATQPGAVRSPTSQAPAGWTALLRDAVATLEPALAAIARSPRTELVRTPRPLRADRITRPDSTVRRALLQGRGRGGVAADLDGLRVREQIPARMARSTLDTPAHRWMAARLDRARSRLARLAEAEAARTPTPRRLQALKELGRLGRRLDRLRRAAPLAGAGAAPPRSVPLVLRRAPHYRVAYAALRQLEGGLALGEGPFASSTPSLAALYEVWATVRVARTLAGLVGVPLPVDAFAVEARGLSLRLRHGRRHALKLDRPGGGRVTLVYQPTFGAPGLLRQRPDLLLVIAAPGRPTRRIVLDAKYRRDDAPAAVRRYGVAPPPEAALGDLHRYRDAIRGPGGQRIVDAAVALYPGRPEDLKAYPASRLARALEEIGVGAIPLVPGEGGPLGAWLARALGG